jgi:hypothetical protein
MSDKSPLEKDIERRCAWILCIYAKAGTYHEETGYNPVEKGL